MTFSVGRAGTVEDISPESWTFHGDRVRVAGDVMPDTFADLKAFQQRLIGHLNNRDEPVIPVVWDDYPEADGFYRLRSASVDLESFVDGGAATWDMTLEPVPSVRSPLIESVLVGADRATGHTNVTTQSPWFALPANADTWSGGLGSEDLTRSGDDVSVKVWTGIDYNLAPSYWLPPGNWYDAAATIEYTDDSGTTWRPVSGESIPNDIEAVRLTNGLTRCTFSLTGGSDQLEVNVSIHDGSSWSTPYPFRVVSETNGTSTAIVMYDPSTISVLRNSPAEVTVRIVSFFGTADTPVSCDVTLRRGAYGVTTRHSYIDTDTAKGGILHWPIVSWSALTVDTDTVGARRTSNDSDGNRAVITLPDALTLTTLGGTIGTLAHTTSAVRAFSAGLFIELDGTSAASGNTGEDLAKQFLAGTHETIRVVSR